MNQEQLNVSLIAIVKTGAVDLIRILVAQGANVNYAEADGKTAIWYAVEKNNMEQIKLLLELGADVNNKCKECPLLIHAIHNKNIEIVKLLLDHGADYMVKDGKKNILNIASMRNADLFTLLLNKCPGVDINSCDGDDACSILFYVSTQFRNVDLTQRLLDMGANPNIQNNTFVGNTPLIRACEDGLIDIVKIFLKHPNIDINIKNKHGETALMKATSYARTEIIDLLKNHNGPKKMFDKDGKEQLVPVCKKPLFNIKVFCQQIPTPTLITIPADTSLECLIWNSATEQWTAGCVSHKENYTIEVTDGKMICHECDKVGFIQFDQLIMADGTMRKHVDLYE